MSFFQLNFLIFELDFHFFTLSLFLSIVKLHEHFKLKFEFELPNNTLLVESDIVIIHNFSIDEGDDNLQKQIDALKKIY